MVLSSIGELFFSKMLSTMVIKLTLNLVAMVTRSALKLTQDT